MSQIREVFLLLLTLIGLSACSSAPTIKESPALINSDFNAEKWPPVKSINLSFSPNLPTRIQDAIHLTIIESILVLDKDIFTNSDKDARQVVVTFEKMDERDFAVCECDNPNISQCKIKFNLSMLTVPRFLVEEIFLHEVGHAFGLDHVDNSKDIMSPATNIDEAEPISFPEFVEFLNRITALNQ